MNRNLRVGLPAMALVLAVVAGGLYMLSAAAERAAGEAHELRYRSYLLADELRQSSDDLTRMARTYAVTGDERFAEYFQRILDIRSGAAARPLGYNGIYWDLVTDTGQAPRGDGDAVALRALMREAGFTREELDFLARSEDESNFLAEIEMGAIEAMMDLSRRDESGGGLGILRLLERIVGDGDMVEIHRDQQAAIAALHGADYHREKALIMAPLNDLFAGLDERTAAAIEGHRGRAGALRWAATGALAGAAALIGALVVVGIRNKGVGE